MLKTEPFKTPDGRWQTVAMEMADRIDRLRPAHTVLIESDSKGQKRLVLFSQGDHNETITLTVKQALADSILEPCFDWASLRVVRLKPEVFRALLHWRDKRFAQERRRAERQHRLYKSLWEKFGGRDPSSFEPSWPRAFDAGDWKG